MTVFLIAMAWRIYLFIAALFLLNSLSGWIFKPSWKEAKTTLKRLVFVPLWPLALFSPTGRAILFKRVETL